MSRCRSRSETGRKWGRQSVCHKQETLLCLEWITVGATKWQGMASGPNVNGITPRTITGNPRGHKAWCAQSGKSPTAPWGGAHLHLCLYLHVLISIYGWRNRGWQSLSCPKSQSQEGRSGSRLTRHALGVMNFFSFCWNTSSRQKGV